VRLETRTWLHRAELGAGPGWASPWRPALYGFLELTDRHYRDPLRELHLTGTPRQVDQEQTRRGAGLHLRRPWTAPLPALGTHRLEALGELRREELRTPPLPGRPEEDRRRRAARLLSVGDNAELLRGRLGLAAFYRWERNGDNFTGADPWRPFAARPDHAATAQGPSLGARFSPGADHAIKLNWAHQARFPTFSELFGYAGTIQGNAVLQPESGTRGDLGWTWTPQRARLGLLWRSECVLYQNDLERMIVLVTVSDRETRPQNLDRARVRGAEASLGVDVRSVGLSLTGYMHWQDARDRGASPVYRGRQLTYRPPRQAYLRGDLTRGPWQLIAAAQYRAASYWGRSNLPQFRSPPQWTEDLTLRYRLARAGLSVALRVENLRDRRLEDVRGHPLPGRSWFLEIEWRTRSVSARAPEGDS
jgi:outer membrane receptor protein involved in Fe transport